MAPQRDDVEELLSLLDGTQNKKAPAKKTAAKKAPAKKAPAKKAAAKKTVAKKAAASPATRRGSQATSGQAPAAAARKKAAAPAKKAAAKKTVAKKTASSSASSGPDDLLALLSATQKTKPARSTATSRRQSTQTPGAQADSGHSSNKVSLLLVALTLLASTAALVLVAVDRFSSSGRVQACSDAIEDIRTIIVANPDSSVVEPAVLSDLFTAQSVARANCLYNDVSAVDQAELIPWLGLLPPDELIVEDATPAPTTVAPSTPTQDPNTGPPATTPANTVSPDSAADPGTMTDAGAVAAPAADSVPDAEASVPDGGTPASSTP